MKIDDIKKNYRKYRWFFTSSGKLVIGGKSAEQNDFLLSLLKETEKDFVVMHTTEPGSPFSILPEEISKLSNSDIEECAIFTGCFSRAWKAGKSKASVDVFRLSQLHKNRNMKQGTWGVFGGVKTLSVPLQLVLTTQKEVLRAVPEKTSKSKFIVKLRPGNINKDNVQAKLELELNKVFSHEELLSALPAGGFKIIKK